MRHQRRGLALTGREQHVHLAARHRRRHRLGEGDQIVGGLAHRRDDHDDVVAPTLGDRDVVGDRTDPVGVGDGRSAVLLDDQGHGDDTLPARPSTHRPGSNPRLRQDF